MRECLAYPSPTTFARVIGLTSRHLSREDALFPEESKRWELYSGMDLEKRVDTVAQKLKGIHEIEKVTHVYFAGIGSRHRREIGRALMFSHSLHRPRQ